MPTPESPRWNDWAGALGRVLQVIVYIPLLYIIVMPWLCLALVKSDNTPFLRGFFEAMASTGWLAASGLTGLAILYVVLSTLMRKKRRNASS